jgi:hypothetical protein
VCSNLVGKWACNTIICYTRIYRRRAATGIRCKQLPSLERLRADLRVLAPAQPLTPLTDLDHPDDNLACANTGTIAPIRARAGRTALPQAICGPPRPARDQQDLRKSCPRTLDFPSSAAAVKARANDHFRFAPYQRSSSVAGSGETAAAVHAALSESKPKPPRRRLSMIERIASDPRLLEGLCAREAPLAHACQTSSKGRASRQTKPLGPERPRATPTAPAGCPAGQPAKAADGHPWHARGRNGVRVGRRQPTVAGVGTTALTAAGAPG